MPVITQRSKRTGEVRQSEDGGVTWTTVTPPMSLPSMSIQTKPADQRLPYQVQTERNKADASNYAPATSAAELEIRRAEAANAVALANAKTQEAVANAAKAEAEVAKLREEQDKTDPKSGAFRALQEQIDRVTELYNQNLQGGLPNAVNNVIPDFMQPDLQAFDSASQGLINPFMAAFRIPGVGSQSDTELKQFLTANTPAQGDSDARIEEKLRNIQTRLNAERPDVSAGLPPITGSNAPQMELATGETRSEIDPVLRATSAKVGQMLAAGESDDAIRSFLADSGVDPSQTSLNQALQYRQTPDFKAWKRANPGKAYPIDSGFYTKEIPLTGGRAMMNTVSQSAPGAFAASAGNALTGGRLDNIAGAMGGDAEMARTGMDLMRGENPLSSLTGDIAGQAMLEGTLGRIPGIRGMMASQWGRRGADGAYGAYSGSGEADDGQGMGAILGAALNAGMGGVGRRAQGALGGSMTGVTNPDLQYLDARGVPLTVGQIGRGTDSIVGNAIGGIEERVVGLPGFDAVIGAARRRGEEGFNKAAFGEAFDALGMPSSGATGAAGVQALDDARRTAYGFLDNTNLPLDAQYAGTNAMIRGDIPDMPEYGNVIAAALKQNDIAAKGGSLPGREWQDAMRAAGQDRAGIAGKPGSRQASAALTEMADNLSGLAARQGPAGTTENLGRANNFNALAETLVKALDNGPAQKADEIFSAGRLDDASRQGRKAFGGRWSAMKGDRPFYDLTSAGKNVMPNLTPDSGSIGRLAIIPVAGGALGAVGGALTGDTPVQGGAEGGMSGLEKGLFGTAALSALYSKPGQRALQSALLGKRPELLKKVGKELINRRKLGGIISSALGRDLVFQPELLGNQR